MNWTSDFSQLLSQAGVLLGLSGGGCGFWRLGPSKDKGGWNGKICGHHRKGNQRAGWAVKAAIIILQKSWG